MYLIQRHVHTSWTPCPPYAGETVWWQPGNLSYSSGHTFGGPAGHYWLVTFEKVGTWEKIIAFFPSENGQIDNVISVTFAFLAGCS